ncbi:MAG: putative toxin-antitoxin system toxin component, PIN family [Nitrospiraceae bacterium]|nr:putative toxin-antitoxin system toxin component, PIN family [Nitrospiraceae bacterium]
MRVVIDTNVFVSSFFGGKPRQVIENWFSGRLTLCVSKPVLKEYFDVFGRFQFDNNALLLKFMSAMEKNSNILFAENPKEVKWVVQDPADNKFIACAIALKAAYIISGDAHLKNMKKVANIKILTPSDMLDLIK